MRILRERLLNRWEWSLKRLKKVREEIKICDERKPWRFYTRIVISDDNVNFIITKIKGLLSQGGLE